MLERNLDAFAALFHDRDRRAALLSRILAATRRLLLCATLLYLAALVLLCLAIHFFAEANMTLVFLAFLPAVTWIAPLALLFVLTLPFSWRLALLQLAAVAAYAGFYMDYETGPAEPPAAAPGDRVLTLLSYNRGQHRNRSFTPFVEKTAPDVIVLQEAYGRAGIYQRDRRFAAYPHVRGIAEFVVLSKFPLGKATLLPTVERGRKRNFAARFELDFAGTPVALYAVHQPTLRGTLAGYLRGAFLHGILGIPGTPWAESRRAERAYWKARAERAREFAETVAGDARPAIAAGDFNMPDHGAIYRSFATRLTDAHEVAGRGFGGTFPGSPEGALARLGPWLRLDYVFTTPAWKTLHLRTEPERASQHRAIVATLVLKEE